FVIYILYR
ncbi:unnamed protein product, partial [Leptidea sinapis]